MFVSGMCAPTFVPKVELGNIFPGGLITFQVSHEGNFKPISGGVEEMKLSLSETELFEKKKK